MFGLPLIGLLHRSDRDWAQTFEGLGARRRFRSDTILPSPTGAISGTIFAVSYFLFGAGTPFLQHAAIAASMAALRLIESVTVVDTIDVAVAILVPRPSSVTSMPRSAQKRRPRARVLNLSSLSPLAESASDHVW